MNKYINEINGEITNKYIVNSKGEPLDQDFGVDPFGDYSYFLNDDLYKLDFEILEDVTGQFYFKFMEA